MATSVSALSEMRKAREPSHGGLLCSRIKPGRLVAPGSALPAKTERSFAAPHHSPSPKPCRPELESPCLEHFAGEALFHPCEFARLLHVCPRHLRRLVRISFGCSVRELLNVLRLKLAKRLLLDGHPLKNIAGGLGLSSAQSFCHFFKVREGITPTRYRALCPPPEYLI
jgi:AraC-like DNA-binding protein